ncbi:hypothetical protein T4D_7817 [Trichinella pseudospiralis]|uniref:Uncharacterized protein n=1 Tax=Trichinella pseudospiralis TaxID=6337 RepID=A0A0V1DPP1_TRIPS|nr:hypothetical protein T4D_7817 [Trichinella pseudospiralis]
MMQKKVKARMTPSKSWTTLRRKIDEKRLDKNSFLEDFLSCLKQF